MSDQIADAIGSALGIALAVVSVPWLSMWIPIAGLAVLWSWTLLRHDGTGMGGAFAILLSLATAVSWVATFAVVYFAVRGSLGWHGSNMAGAFYGATVANVGCLPLGFIGLTIATRTVL